MGSPETCPTCGSDSGNVRRLEINRCNGGTRECRDTWHHLAPIRLTPTPPAPETCPTCHSDDPDVRLRVGNINDRYPCLHDWHKRSTPPAPADDATRESASEAMREAYAKTFGQMLARDICESEPSGAVIDAQDRLKGTEAETFLVIDPRDLAEWVQRNVSNAFYDGEITLAAEASAGRDTGAEGGKGGERG